jgi:hypothetical protein
MSKSESVGAAPGDALRPGFAPQRMVALMSGAVERLRLDLRGLNVLTEATSGAYACTAVLAAMARARWVYAYARDTAYGSCGDLARQTLALARAAGVQERVEIVTLPPHGMAFEAQIVTNSGSLRPLDAELVARLPQGAVVALMYEAWEFRPGDVDLSACLARQIPVVALNERHPAVDVFPYLGPLAVRELHDAGIAVHGCRIAVLCDNDFGPFICRTLESVGGAVWQAETPDALPVESFDAVLVALQPRGRLAVDADEARRLVDRHGPVPLVQFWGDLDRATLASLGMSVWPPEAPPPGRMGILFPAIGPEAVVHLQAGGLRAAELVYRGGAAAATPDSVAELLRPTVLEFGGSA